MKLSDVKFLKMKRSDYENQIIVGKSIQCFSEWNKWVDKYLSVNQRTFNRACRLLLGDNRLRFKRLFGKCAFTFNGSHYYHGWLADLGTVQVIIFTSKGAGSRYEVVVKNREGWIKTDIGKAVKFLDMISRLPKD